MSYDLKWCLFRGIVCTLLEKHGYIGDKWGLSGYLETSFEETVILPYSQWESVIEGGLLEYKSKEGSIYFE